jgi:hypothetical protein
VQFAIDIGFNLIQLANRSKAPPNTYKYEPMTLSEALDWIHNGGNLGVRGDKQFCLLDYDAKELTSELAWLATKTLTITTPNGWTFFTLETLNNDLWLEMEKQFPGFAPSEAMVKARAEKAAKWEVDEPLARGLGFSDDEINAFLKPTMMVSNARRGRSYVVLPGSVTCVYQTKATGLKIPTNPETGKSIQHFGFGHTDSDQPCNGNPRTTQILPFRYFAEVALKRRAIA